MPKKTKQVLSEIVYELRRERKIDQDVLDRALSKAGIDGNSTRIHYVRSLINEGLLKRTEGGFILTERARKDTTIRITLPVIRRDAVIKAIDSAIQQFKPLTTMELEE